MFKSLFLPIIAVMLFIVVTGLMYQGKLGAFTNKMGLSKSQDKVIKIEDLEIKVETAKTNEERARGLSNRDSLDENSGMVFVFEENSKPSFWMKDTKIALDIVWINDNKIVGIEKNVKPEIGVEDSKLLRYPSPTEIDYVLELNGGFSDKNDIKVGQSLSGLEQL